MSQLEATFAFQLHACGIDDYEREYMAIPGRRYRFDFAFVPDRVLVEIQGGTWNGGAHGRGSGINRDYEKANLAIAGGWKLLQFDSKMVRSGEAIRMTEQVLKGAK